MQAPRTQKPVGEDMATVGVGAKLDLIHRDEIGANVQGHGFNRADPILAAVGHDSLFASHQPHHRGPSLGDDPVINLARQQSQRQADNAGTMGQHAFNRVMSFAGVGRPKDRRDPGAGVHLSGVHVWASLK